MISERERGFYKLFLVATFVATILLFIVFYLLNLAFRGGWNPAPDAYAKCLFAVLLGMVLEAMTRPEEQRLSAGQAGRRQAMAIAQRQALWVLAFLGLLLMVSRDARISRIFVFGFAGASYPFFYFLQRSGRRLVLGIFRGGSLNWRMRTLIVGPPAWCRSIHDRFVEDPQHDRVVELLPMLEVAEDASSSELIGKISEREIDVLVMPARIFPDRTVIDLLELGDRRGFRCLIPLELSRRYGRRFELQRIGDLSVLSPPSLPLANPYNRLVKRVFDIVVSAGVVTAVLLPLMLLVWLIQRRYSPGPLFFRQERVGENGRVFWIFKFRTMTVGNPDETRQATSDDARVYRGARWLRRLSIDEFPQFLNVLRGEMSIVGPRPHMVTHERQFEEFHELYGSRRYVKPGVTGLAQVRGYRGEIKDRGDIRGRARYDLVYVRRWSMVLDLRLIVATALQVIKPHRNAY